MKDNFLFSLVLAFIGLLYAVSVQSEAKTINDSVNLAVINPLNYGAIGDGVTDDTIGLQKAFRTCSVRGWQCRLPKNKSFLVKEPLFLWGKASLIGEGTDSEIIFDVNNAPYLLNLGISGRNKLEKPFTGAISNVDFKIRGGKGGRIIFLWRTAGAIISNNTFDVGSYAYSATSSGNDNRWVKNGFKNLVRKNIIIERNTITAKVDNIGSEGIGLGHFDGAIIKDNIINGVGDDPIGVHFSKNIRIINNKMKSVDGRLFVANSVNVEVVGNEHQRIASLLDNKFYKGISLLYIGFENSVIKSKLSAPTNINVYNNYLAYPEGAIDAGAAIYLYGPRNVSVFKNIIVNDSSKVVATAIHMLPKVFSTKWSDPDNRDGPKLARVWDVSVHNNITEGKYPQKIIMTGNCVSYAGEISISANLASGYQIYCQNIKNKDNIKIKANDS